MPLVFSSIPAGLGGLMGWEPGWGWRRVEIVARLEAGGAVSCRISVDELAKSHCERLLISIKPD